MQAVTSAFGVLDRRDIQKMEGLPYIYSRLGGFYYYRILTSSYILCPGFFNVSTYCS